MRMGNLSTIHTYGLRVGLSVLRWKDIMNRVITFELMT